MADKWDRLFDSPTKPSKTCQKPKLRQQASTVAAVQEVSRGYEVVGAEGVSVMRLKLVSRTGTVWSYPYGYVGLIEMARPGLLVLHGSCAAVRTIQIEGRGLEPLLNDLNLQRVTEVRESDDPRHDEADTVVTRLVIQLEE